MAHSDCHIELPTYAGKFVMFAQIKRATEQILHDWRIECISTEEAFPISIHTIKG